MSRRADFSDLRVLEALATHGPRNVTEVARKLDMAAETLRKRIKRLRSQFFLRFGINIYHTFLGLKKAIVFAEAISGYEDMLLGILKKNDFWIALARCYGMFEGCVGVFIIPKDHCAEFEHFLHEVQELGVARNIQLFWSTCFQSVSSRCNWFDQKSSDWKFQWDEWIKEIRSEKTELPYTLVDPTSFPMKGDEIDILILKELEKDATISFNELGKKLGISPQLVRYHYQKHLVEQGLIESFEVTFFHFGRQISDFSFFIFRFDSIEKLARFASSLLDKPFVKALGKIVNM